MTISIRLTPEKTSQITTIDDQAKASIANASTGKIQSNQFVFFAAFDGTNNDFANSGNTQNTNVAELWDQYRPNIVTGSNYGGNYYPGLGTKALSINNLNS